MPVITRRVALLMLLLAIARPLLPDNLPGGIWGLAGGVLLLALIDWLLAVPPGQLEAGRELPAQAPLGGTAEVALVVRNPTGRGIRIAVADELAPSLQAETRRWTIRIPARSEARLATTIHPGRRGRFEPENLALRVFGPLGLAARQATVPLHGVLKVVPAFPSRRDAELRLARARKLELGLRTVRLPGSGTDFEQLREYSPDDDFRRIDWAATARSGSPVVRTYRAERNQTVLALIDVGRTTAGRVLDVPRLEHLLDALFALVTVATGLGERIGVVAFDDEVRATVAASNRPDQLSHVVEAVYELEPALVETNHRRAFTHTLAHHRRRSTLVILTELNDATVYETLLPSLPLILGDHRVIIVAVNDPEVEQWAHAATEDSQAAYRRAAASSALESRRRLAALLHGLGAIVIDEPPGKLAPALADIFIGFRMA